MYYKTLYINLFSTLRFSFYSPLFLPLFFFFCHQPLINPFVATVYTFLYFLPLFLPLFFFFATFLFFAFFVNKKKRRRRRGANGSGKKWQSVKKTKKAKKSSGGKKWQKIKVRVKSSINPFMTQFVGIGGKKVAKKCHCCSALSQQGLRDVGGKKQWCFFIFQLLRYKKKYVRFYSKIVIFFCHFATF